MGAPEHAPPRTPRGSPGDGGGQGKPLSWEEFLGEGLGAPDRKKVCDDVQSGIMLPSWHCAFANCRSGECIVNGTEQHEKGIWSHVWSLNGHRDRLKELVRKHHLLCDMYYEEEAAFTLYNAAIAEQERASVPKLGVCTDRRCLRHIGETFREGNTQVLMCFVCGGKHLAHSGYDCDLRVPAED